MMEREHLLSDLAARLASHVRSSPTGPIPRLSIWCSDAPVPPVPALFEPVVFVLLQGGKRITIEGRTLELDGGTCATSAVGLPYVREVVQASREQPYVGLELKLDPRLLVSLLLEVPGDDGRNIPNFAAMQADMTVLEALARLLRLLTEPAAIPVLGPLAERELTFRLLQGPLGPTLRRVGQPNSRFGQIRAAAEWIGTHAAEPMSVHQLASSANMSVTSFHRHFKVVTGTSPLAYQRYIRLLEARRLLTSGGNGITKVAFAVGYGSGPQFSREYKRLFGVSPAHDAAVLRSGNARASRARRGGDASEYSAIQPAMLSAFGSRGEVGDVRGTQVVQSKPFIGK